MNKKCPNCESLVLVDDVTCWQCGCVLSEQTKETSSPTSEIKQTEVFDPTLSSQPVTTFSTMFVIYTSVTIILIILGFLLTNFLGHQPIIQPNIASWQTDWQPIDNQQANFTMNLPNEWELLWLSGGTLIPFQEKEIQDEWQTVTTPFIEASTNNILLAGQPNPPRPEDTNAFVLVVDMPISDKLSPEEILDNLQSDFIDVERLETMESVDQRIVNLELSFTMDSFLLKCRHQIHTQTNTNFLIVACTPIRYYQTDRGLFEQILESFHPLSS